MAKGPIERLPISQGEPRLFKLMRGNPTGPVEPPIHAGPWLIDRSRREVFFTADFVVHARQVFPSAEIQSVSRSRLFWLGCRAFDREYRSA